MLLFSKKVIIFNSFIISHLHRMALIFQCLTPINFPFLQVMKTCSKLSKIFLTAMVHELYKTGMGETTFEKVILSSLLILFVILLSTLCFVRHWQ